MSSKFSGKPVASTCMQRLQRTDTLLHVIWIYGDSRIFSIKCVSLQLMMELHPDKLTTDRQSVVCQTIYLSYLVFLLVWLSDSPRQTCLQFPFWLFSDKPPLSSCPCPATPGSVAL